MSGDVNAMRNNASETLIHIYNFADREKRISEQQAEDAKANKDFHAMRFHQGYAHAMQKIRNQVSALARANFGFDVTA